MMPIVDGLAGEFEGQVQVVRLNGGITAEQELAKRYGLLSHPSFALIDGQGNVSQQFFGPQTEETLREAINQIRP